VHKGIFSNKQVLHAVTEVKYNHMIDGPHKATHLYEIEVNYSLIDGVDAGVERFAVSVWRSHGRLSATAKRKK
jgi:hypothetical protein